MRIVRVTLAQRMAAGVLVDHYRTRGLEPPASWIAIASAKREYPERKTSPPGAVNTGRALDHSGRSGPVEKTTHTMTPETLAEIRKRDAGITPARYAGGMYWAAQDRRDLLTELDARAVTIVSLATQLDQALARAEALVELFTYESLGEPGRVYARFKGDAEVTDEVAAVLLAEVQS